MIQIEGYDQYFNHQKLFHIHNFNVKKHDFVIITGASGCGKTTLLNKLYHLSELNKYSKEYVLQNNMLLDELTLYENIYFFIKDNQAQANQYLELLDLKHVLNLPAYQLSEGQKQRATFLRALLMRPEILFLDEVTSKQNTEMIQIMMKLLKEMQCTMTIIMVTHDLSLLEYANKHYAFVDGELKLIQYKEEIRKDKPSDYCGACPIWKLVIKNMKSHLKDDFLILLCLTLLCTTFMLSFYAGKNLKNEISAWYQKQYSYYSLNVSFTDGVKNVDEVIAVCDELGVDDYILNMQSIQFPQTILVNQQPVQINSIEIDNTLADHIVKLPNIALKEANVELSVFSGSKEEHYYRWAGSTINYDPQYKQIEISTEILNTNQDVLILSTKMLTSLLKQANDPTLDRSNLLVNSFILRFDDKQEFSDTKERLTTSGYYLYDYGDELKAINKQITEQFNPFLYVSYFIVVIIVVITAILLISKSNKTKRSSQILSYLHYSFKRKNLVYTIENLIIGGIALILSFTFSLLVMNQLNHVIDLSRYVSLGTEFTTLNNFIQTLPLYSVEIGQIGILSILFILFLAGISTLIQRFKMTS